MTSILNPAQPAHKTVLTMDDGARVAVFAYGSGPPLLLCNGYVCTRHYWPLWIREFMHGHTVIAWDYRGYGVSPPLADARTATIERFALDAANVIAAVDRGPAIVIGHSMGCQVAFETYKRAPELVRGLIAVCGTYEKPQAPLVDFEPLDQVLAFLARYWSRTPEKAAQVIRPIAKSRIATMLAYRIGANPDLCPPQYIEALFDHVASMDPRVMLHNFASAVTHSAEDVLGRIDVPALIIGGERDGMTPPEVSEKMHQLIPDSELLICEQCSHLAQIERPEMVHARVEKFFAERF